MSKLRLQRVAEQMKHVISQVVARELKDPRCGFITIVSVKIAPDLKSAHVNYSVLGTEAQKRSAQRAMSSAGGYIQSRVARETTLKYTPVMSFHFDKSVEREINLSKRIDTIVEADRRTATARAIRARIAEGSIPSDIVDAVSQAAVSDAFLEHTAGLLIELMSADTTARADLCALAAAERQCFETIEADLQQTWADGVRAEVFAIDPDIESDPAYAPPAYAADSSGAPPTAEAAYKDRANLIAVLERGDLGEPADLDADELIKPLRLALHTHIDTRPPHAPPVREGDVISGPGAGDAKGQVAMILGAFRLLKQLRDEFGVRVREDLCAQFVIDAETGGNGALCLALQDPLVCDGTVVCAPTELAVWPVACEPDEPLALYASESVRRVAPNAPPASGRRDPDGDAAILADLFPGRDIIVFGAASPPADRICLHEIAAGAKMLTFLVLESAGFLV